MDDRLKRMKELAGVLSEASRAYYQESRELMSNLEYDRLYDELLRLEEETGTVFAGSPTQKVGYEVLSELPRERHEKPMLSLNKTKSVDELKEWLGNQTGLLSWPHRGAHLRKRCLIQGSYQRQWRDRGGDHRKRQDLCEPSHVHPVQGTADPAGGSRHHLSRF